MGFRIGDFKLKIDPSLLSRQGRYMRKDGRAQDQLRPVGLDGDAELAAALHRLRGVARQVVDHAEHLQLVEEPHSLSMLC